VTGIGEQAVPLVADSLRSGKRQRIDRLLSHGALTQRGYSPRLMVAAV
jgi:hypothetical protein